MEPDERLAVVLKRISDLSANATKVGLIGLLALAVVWFGEVRPAYNKLLRPDGGYAQIERSFKKQGEHYSEIEARRAAQKPHVTEDVTTAIRDEELKRDQLIESVSFDVFGLKIPVPPLYAPVVWTALAIAALVYMAQARRTVWTLLAVAVSLAKSLNRTWDRDEPAGSGPLWLAPVPRDEPSVTGVNRADLVAAFDWHTLRTLPNLAASLGLALLVVVQLDVVRLSTLVLRRAAQSSDYLTQLSPMPNGVGDFGDLVVGQQAAASLSLLLFVTLMGTVAVAAWWCRRWDLSRPVPDRLTMYQLAARFSTIFLSIGAICVVIGTQYPEAALYNTYRATSSLSVLIAALVGAIIAVGVTELIFVAYGTEASQVIEALVPRLKALRPQMPANGVILDTDRSLSLDRDTHTDADRERAREPLSRVNRATLERRHLIMGGVGAIAAMAWVIYRQQWAPLRAFLRRQPIPRPAWTRFNKKRQRRAAQVKWTDTNLKEGFYAPTNDAGHRTKGGKHPVIHYADATGRILFASLGPATVRALTTSVPEALATRPPIRNPARQTPPLAPRVDLGRASALFELAALERIKAGHYSEAGDFLVQGITHDLAFKRPIRHGPSIRLYDLLARVSVRCKLGAHNEALFVFASQARELVINQFVGAPAGRSFTRARRRRTSATAITSANASARRLANFDKRILRWRSDEWKSMVLANEQVWKITCAPGPRGTTFCGPASTCCEEFRF